MNGNVIAAIRAAFDRRPESDGAGLSIVELADLLDRSPLVAADWVEQLVRSGEMVKVSGVDLQSCYVLAGGQLGEEERPTVRLLGADGNAFAILGACRSAAKQAGWPPERWSKVRDEMTAGDYNHLLATVMEHFEVE